MIVFAENNNICIDTASSDTELPKLGAVFDSTRKLWVLEKRYLPSLTLAKLEELSLCSEDSAKALLQHYIEDGKYRLTLSVAAKLKVNLKKPRKLKYLPFQKAGIAYALSNQATLIADEMGLGKTVQAIGVINNSEHIKKVLIACPASLKLNWAKEIAKWTTKKAYIRVLTARGDLLNKGDPHEASLYVLVANYEILHKIKRKLPKKIDLLIADEAQYVKNETTTRAKALKEISKSASKRIFLSGTPLLNRPIELWNILDTLQPGAWGSMQDFGIRYADGRRQRAKDGNVVWSFKGASNLGELQEKLRRHVMVRRLKEDVLTELPAKVRQIVPLENTDKRTVDSGLNKKIESLWTKVKKAKSKTSYQQAVGLLDREVAVAFQDLAKVRHQIAIKKAPQVVQFITDMLDNVEKVVVFAHHRDVVDYLEKKLKKFGVVTLTGSSSARQKQASVDAFQKDPKVRVFIGNIMAAGTGHTLTKAQHVVFAEIDWVPGNMKQAEDRCHRIGQQSTVFVYHLVLDNTVDSILANALVAKMDIEEKVLGTNQVKAPDKKEITEEYFNDSPSEAGLTKDERQALLYGIYHLAVAKDNEGFISKDAPVGRYLAMKLINGEPLEDKHLQVAHVLLRKYSRARLPLSVVSTLYPSVADFRKKQLKIKRSVKEHLIQKKVEKQLAHDPLWGA